MRTTSVVRNSRLVFAVTALLAAPLVTVACSQQTARQSQAPAAEPATSAAPPAPPPEAPAPAAAAAQMEAESQRANEESVSTAKDKGRDDLGEAVAELEQARVELDSALSTHRARPASASGAAPSRGADLDEAPRGEAKPAPKAEKKTGESSCSTACRAYASLGRAASAVCRLAGEKDARCTHAHEVMADAERRVAVCACAAP